MTNTVFTRSAIVLWIVLLTAASMFSTWALACMTPFAALAALAATHMRARDGATLMVVTWAVSQGVGFGVLHYPHDASTIEWGAALGLAALAAVGGAYAALGATGVAGLPARLAVAFAAAFVAFKAVLLVADVVLGGSFASTVAPSLLLGQLPREAAITVALLALYRGLIAIGVPTASAPVADRGAAFA